MKARDLAAALAALGDHLQNLGVRDVGVIRQAARVLAGVDRLDDVTFVPADGTDRCPRCSAPIAQPPTGRRRVWCSAKCRKAASDETRSKRHDAA